MYPIITLQMACLKALLADLPLQELHGGDAAGGAPRALQHRRLAAHPVHQDRVEVARVERQSTMFTWGKGKRKCDILLFNRLNILIYSYVIGGPVQIP